MGLDIGVKDVTSFNDFTAGVRQFANETAALPGGRILAAYNAKTGKNLGMAAVVYNERSKHITIKYMYTHPLFRREGVASAMLANILNAGDTVSSKHSITGAGSGAYDALMKKHGFKAEHTFFLYKFLCDKESTKSIGDFLPKAANLLFRQGYSVLPFSDCSARQLHELERTMYANEDLRGLNPFNNPEAVYSNKVSFIVYKDGLPISYMVNQILNNGENLHSLFGATVKEHRREGAFILPCYMLMLYFKEINWTCRDMRLSVAVGLDNVNLFYKNKFFRGAMFKHGDVYEYTYSKDGLHDA